MEKIKNNPKLRSIIFDLEGNQMPTTMCYNPLFIKRSEFRKSFEDIGIKEGE